MKRVLGIGIIFLLASCGRTTIENYTIKKDKVNFENLVYLDVDKEGVIFTTSEDKYGSYIYELKSEKVDTLDYLVTKDIEKKEIGRKYKNVVKTSNEGIYIYQNEEGKYLLFNEKNSKRSEEYNLIEEVNGKYYVQKAEAKGYIDEEFNTVVALEKYRYLGKIQDNIALAYYNGKWGVAQKDFLPDNFKYEEAYVGKNGNWIVKNQTGKYIDGKGEILEIEKIIQSPNSTVVYSKGDFMGIIDVNTLTFSKPLFDEIGVDEKTAVIGVGNSEGKEYFVAKIDDILKWESIKDKNYHKFLYIEKIGKDTYNGISKDGISKLIIGDKIIDREYIEIFKKNNFYICQKVDEDSYDIYSNSGKLLITTKKEDIKYIGENCLVCANDKEYKIIKGVE